jgi:hypothetical protein
MDWPRLLGLSLERSTRNFCYAINISPQKNRISLMDRRRVKLPVRPFISLEKDLASMGSFIPSAKRIQRAKKKTVQFTREFEGKQIQLRGHHPALCRV